MNDKSVNLNNNYKIKSKEIPSDVGKSNNSKIKAERELREYFSSDNIGENSDSFVSSNKNPVKIDGMEFDYKIGKFEQGDVGDCWLLSDLKSLSKTEFGKDIIRNAISIDLENKNVTVALPNVDKEYTFSLDEIKNRTDLSTGDYDVIVMEMATEKYRKDIVSQFRQGLAEGKSVNELPKIPSHWTKGLRSAAQGGGILHSGAPGEFNQLMFDGRKKTLFLNTSGNILSKDENGKTGLVFNINKDNFENHLDITKNPATIAFREDFGDLVANHGYTIVDIDENTFTLINPHDSSKEIKINKKDMKGKFAQITYLEPKND